MIWLAVLSWHLNTTDNISKAKTQTQNNLCIKCVEVVEDSVLTKSPNYITYCNSFLKQIINRLSFSDTLKSNILVVKTTAITKPLKEQISYIKSWNKPTKNSSWKNN